MECREQPSRKSEGFITSVVPAWLNAFGRAADEEDGKCETQGKV